MYSNLFNNESMHFNNLLPSCGMRKMILSICKGEIAVHYLKCGAADLWWGRVSVIEQLHRKQLNWKEEMRIRSIERRFGPARQGLHFWERYSIFIFNLNMAYSPFFALYVWEIFFLSDHVKSNLGLFLHLRSFSYSDSFSSFTGTSIHPSSAMDGWMDFTDRKSVV